MTVTAEISLKAYARHTKAGDLGDPAVRKEIEAILQLASGVGAGQADLLYADEFSIVASGTGDLDLAGVLTDAFGVVIAGVELVAIIVTAAAANTNDVLVGGAAATQVAFLGAVTDKVPVKPGGVFLLAAPGAAGMAPITGGSADKLGLANSSSGTPVTGKVWILARSA